MKMKNNHKFEGIYVKSFVKDSHVFYKDSDSWNNYDCHETCIIWHNMKFYGVPVGLSETEWEEVYVDDSDKIFEIGEIHGNLILCKSILDNDEDPWQLCDDIDGDLEYTISALQDSSGPLNPIDGEPYQDVYYIHRFELIMDYDDVELKSNIINELPNLIFTLLHVKPDILAYYPSPLEYSVDSAFNDRQMALQHIVMQKLSVPNKGDSNENNKRKIVDFGRKYRFSEDEMNIIMGRRNSESSYPEEAKDLKEFEFYIINGFKEAGDSRLLYKCVD